MLLKAASPQLTPAVTDPTGKRNGHGACPGTWSDVGISSLWGAAAGERASGDGSKLQFGGVANTKFLVIGLLFSPPGVTTSVCLAVFCLPGWLRGEIHACSGWNGTNTQGCRER